MNIYTFHINTERVTPSFTVCHIKAHTQDRAWKQIESEFPLKGITLKFINDVPYVPEPEDDSYCPPDPEERYWAAVTTWAERHSTIDEGW